MLDKLFKRADKKAEAVKEAAKPAPESQENPEDGLDETGTFMLDVNQLKECEDLDDLLKDV
ncbi:MAG: hypothetical protein ACAI44_34820 [Candidatus Sericytochromatia bacterium]